MSDSSAEHPDDAAFEHEVDAFIDHLAVEPGAEPMELLRLYPDRAADIHRLLDVAHREVPEGIESGSLPPLPAVASPWASGSAVPWQDPVQPAAGAEFTLPVTLGPYELTELLGRGGMGLVYRARQTEPIPRTVAIKVVHPALGGTELLGRFANERRSLARMNHRHIAMVLDGGTTPDDRPYLVMELVDGTSLTDYCSKQQLSLEQRLRLFLKVCAAIQHAHQNGIIHRDIKPSNILVAETDGEPDPKVIDFGLAKVFAGDDSFASFHTRLGHILGTWQYMSPEQAGLQTDDLDVRSDVFLLGIVLFELLTGTTPLVAKLSGDMPFDERLRMVRQQEPVRPSDRIRDAVRAKASAADSVSSHTDSGMRWIELRGDLDAICLQAMATDPARRYATVAALTDDIECYLANRPVLAAKPSKLVPWLKFAYRNRVAVPAVLVSAVLLCGITLFSSWMAIRAVTAERLSASRYEDLLLAEASEQEARRWAEQNLYVAHMNLVQRAFEEQDPVQASLYLERHVPQAGETDRRGFEWYYWKRRLEKLSSELVSSQELFALAYSHDGRLLAAAGMAGQVHLWDARTGQLLGELDSGSDFIGTISFSSDDRMLAVARRDRRATVWDVAAGSVLLDIPHPDAVRTAVFANNDATLVTGGVDSVIRLWDTESGELQQEWTGHDRDVYHLAVSADGQWLASGGQDRTARIWDLASGRCVATLAGHTGTVRSVAFSPKGRLLATGSYDGTALLWDVDTHEPVHRLQEHDEQVYGVAFSPDGRLLASASRDETVKLWDVQTGDVTATLLGHRFTISGVAFAPDGETLASCAYDKTVKIWNPAAVQDVKVAVEHRDTVTSVAFSPDDLLLASGSWDGMLQITRWAGPHDVKRWELGRGPVHALEFLSESRSIGNRRILAGFGDGTLGVIDVDSGAVLSSVQAHDGRVTSARIAPHGRQVVTAGTDGRVRLWDLPSLSLDREFAGHQRAVYAAVWSPDARLLFTGGDDGEALVWNVQRSEVRLRLAHHEGRIYDACFSTDGRTFYYAGRDRVIRMCDTTSGEVLQLLQGQTSSVHSMTLTDKDRTLVSAGTDMQIYIWDRMTGEVKTSLKGHLLPIKSIAFSPSGRVLASTSGDRTVRLWYR